MRPLYNPGRLPLLPVLVKRAYTCRKRSYRPPTTRLLSTRTLNPSTRRHSTKRPDAPPQRTSRTIPRLLILGVALGGAIYYFSVSPTNTTLNGKTFIPYTITAREPVSPTSFILTVSPNHPDPSPPYLLPSSSAWRHAHWSLEFKQPEVQIARHYTPLPPLPDSDRDEPAGGGALRFYIRALGTGEMSRYLARLRVGQDVWVRGPHAGFDLRERLGHRAHVVFLAGGTGVAPAMQAAHMILGGSEQTTFSLLWAVRRRDELQYAAPANRPWWDFRSGSTPLAFNADVEAPSPVARQLQAMKAKYGDRLSVQVAIDNEGTFFQEKDLRSALAHGASKHSSTPTLPGFGCPSHDPRLLETASEFSTPGHICECKGSAGAPRGKNLFVVSGPEGFVSHFAGPKVWRGGAETQGPVGGVAAHLLKQHPQLASEWLVLKM